MDGLMDMDGRLGDGMVLYLRINELVIEWICGLVERYCMDSSMST